MRRAVQDNREVFVGLANQLGEEIERKHRGTVEDLEKLVGEVIALQDGLEEAKRIERESAAHSKKV